MPGACQRRFRGPPDASGAAARSACTQPALLPACLPACLPPYRCGGCAALGGGLCCGLRSTTQGPKDRRGGESDVQRAVGGDVAGVWKKWQCSNQIAMLARCAARFGKLQHVLLAPRT